VKSFITGLALFAACTSFACVDSEDTAPEPIAGVVPIDSPAPPGSAQPQLASTPGGAMLSWIERQGKTATLRFAERRDDSWSEPRTVASGDNWFINWADVPSVARLADGSLAAHWLQKSGTGTYAYDVRVSFSHDGGRTWTPPVTPHHDGTQTEHGFASLFDAPRAGLGLVWLDGRAMKSEGHGGHGAGAMTLRAATFDPPGRQLSEAAIDERVCECCPTATAVTSNGPIVAFRNRSDDEVRDIFVSRLIDGAWTEPVPAHRDNWKIPACPVNGPALAARGRRVALAWFTMQEGEGRAFVAFSDDAGATFGAPIRVDDEATLGRVDVELMDDGAASVGWIEFSKERSEFRVRRVSGAGDRGLAQTISEVGSARGSGYPRLARSGAGLLAAWTETGESPRVRTALVR
jgi:hypothetical protein